MFPEKDAREFSRTRTSFFHPPDGWPILFFFVRLSQGFALTSRRDY